MENQMKHTPRPWRALGSSIIHWGKSSLNNRDDKTMQLAVARLKCMKEKAE